MCLSLISPVLFLMKETTTVPVKLSGDHGTEQSVQNRDRQKKGDLGMFIDRPSSLTFWELIYLSEGIIVSKAEKVLYVIVFDSTNKHGWREQFLVNLLVDF